MHRYLLDHKTLDSLLTGMSASSGVAYSNVDEITIAEPNRLVGDHSHPGNMKGEMNVERMMAMLVANPFATLSVYFTTDATTIPPKALSKMAPITDA